MKYDYYFSVILMTEGKKINHLTKQISTMNTLVLGELYTFFKSPECLAIEKLELGNFQQMFISVI